MPLDLTKPVTTDNYSTGVLPTIRGNDLALAKFLEGETVTGAQTGIKRYNAASDVFEYWNGSAWVQMPLNVSGNAGTATTLQTARTINGTSFNGSANITTDNWGTARTLTIGNTGKSVNGSANVSWSLAEIGVTAATETASGLVELATVAEAQAGTDTVRAVTPQGLAAYAGALSFRNKLINAAFTINQRGYASGAATTAANQYTLDRWRVVTSGQNLSWSGTAPNITITAPAGGVEQVIEGIWIEGGTYTLSWTGTATATVNGSAVANGGTVTLTAGANATVRFSGGTVSKPQLELGPYATQFEHRPYSLERMLCQRYYWEARSDTYLQGYGSGAGASTYQKVFFPTIMRSVPTVTASFGAAANATGSIIGTTSDGFTIRAMSAAGGVYAIMFYSGSNANAEL